MKRSEDDPKRMRKEALSVIDRRRARVLGLEGSLPRKTFFKDLSDKFSEHVLDGTPRISNEGLREWVRELIHSHVEAAKNFNAHSDHQKKLIDAATKMAEEQRALASARLLEVQNLQDIAGANEIALAEAVRKLGELEEKVRRNVHLASDNEALREILNEPPRAKFLRSFRNLREELAERLAGALRGR